MHVFPSTALPRLRTLDRRMPHTEFTPHGHITHPALHIRDTPDCHRVLEAVRLGILPLVKQRLTTEQRTELRSGNVFVWEESEHDDGFVRWTDGRRWSQSKTRGDCLYYEEKIGMTDAEKKAKAARRAMKAAPDLSHLIPTPPRRQDRPDKIDGLTKQTYSVIMKPPGAARAAKWHLVAYVSARDAPHLPTVDAYAYLRNIPIPSSVFLGHGHGHGNPDGVALSWPLQMPESPSPSTPPEASSSHPHSTSYSYFTPRPGQPDADAHAFPLALPPMSMAMSMFPAPATTIAPASRQLQLPSLSALRSASASASIPRRRAPAMPMEGNRYPYGGYAYCPDDRRMLDRLRVRI
ncbi:Gti1/Pac2 family-domain-containing protein [Mycena filopes]|nr:Gti1/Pac2 family-domain-containing protein [Mycena filopes]